MIGHSKNTVEALPELIAVRLKYDPFDRRIYKLSSSGTSIYAYDGANLIEETNASGAVVARCEDTQKGTER
jgi:hypothetical protein